MSDKGAIRPGSARESQALVLGEAGFRGVFASSIVGVILADVDGNVAEANDFFLRLLGYTREDLPLRRDDVTPLEWRALDQAKITEVVTMGEAAPWEKEYVARDGRRVPVLVGMALLEKSRGVCVGVTLDLTGRKHAEYRLVERKAQLQALANELVLTEERERRRIARWLHDDIGQTLAIVRGRIGALRSLEGCKKAARSLDEVVLLLEDVIASTRTLTFELGSPVLYELGLEAALEGIGEDMEKQGLRFHFEAGPLPDALPESARAVIFRVARELLFNVVKHARARRVWLTLRQVERWLYLTVEDDGVGFEAGFREGRRKGFGLFGIRHQADLLGWRVEIDAGPKAGTRVVVVIPLD